MRLYHILLHENNPIVVLRNPLGLTLSRGYSRGFHGKFHMFPMTASTCRMYLPTAQARAHRWLAPCASTYLMFNGGQHKVTKLRLRCISSPRRAKGPSTNKQWRAPSCEWLPQRAGVLARCYCKKKLSTTRYQRQRAAWNHNRGKPVRAPGWPLNWARDQPEAEPTPDWAF